MKNKWNKQIIVLAIALFFNSIPAFAAENESPLSVKTTESSIRLYIDNPGYEAVPECQIGTKKCETIAVSPISEEAIPVKTIFLVDNSLSIQEKYRPGIQEILNRLAACRMNGEQFSVASFSTQIEYLLENSSDYSQIREAVESITYQNQDTYLTDVLYELLQQLQEQEDSFVRIIVISDGVDNKAIGYTKEELYSLLEKYPCPIYTLGCVYQNNNEQLKNMFALSRLTGGESWLLDDVSDPQNVVDGVCSINDALKVEITPESADCDGTTKGIRLVMAGGDTTVQYKTEVQMPFAEALKEEPEEESAKESAEEQKESESALYPTIAVTERHPEDEKTGNSMLFKILPVILFLAAAGLIAGIFLVKRKKGSSFKQAPDTSFSNSKIKNHLKEESDQKQEKRRITKIAGSDPKHKTRINWDIGVKLTDQDRPEKVFQVNLENQPVIVGYNQDCQICLNYDEYVSGKHCQIFMKDREVMVSNLSKSNPTKLNGKMTEREEILKSGDVLTLGKLKMKVEIYQ